MSHTIRAMIHNRKGNFDSGNFPSTIGRFAMRCGQLVVAAGACLLLSAAAAHAQGGPPCVTIGSAKVCGQVKNEDGYQAHEYLGIRYSNAGRFEAKDTPIAPVSMSATAAGAVCPQIVMAGPTEKPVGAEDCLFLNVWTPTGATPASRLPVAVYIHGGAFIQGASTGVDGSPLLFNGTELSNLAGGTIVVTFNYRLGALGFLTFSDGTSNLAGNYGFLDQVAALKWVKSYIQSFGGDPQKVMIFGQSAGAVSVGLHAWSSKSSQGTFRSFIMESNPLGVGVPTPATAKQTGAALLQAYNALPTTNPKCNTISCLRNAHIADLSTAAFYVYETAIKSFANSTAPNANNLLPWGPNLDGSIILRQPLAGARDSAFRGNYVFGTNSAEGVYFESLLDLLFVPINATYYGNFLASLFGGTAPANLPPQYVCPAGSDDCGAQFARLITDYVFTCPNRLTSLLSAGGGGVATAYGYQFRHVPSFGYPSICPTEVCHSAELPFVWDNDVVGQGSNFTPQEASLAATMSKLWAFMAASGQPKSTTILNTPWRPLSPGDNYLILDLGSFAVNNTPAVDASCGYWDQQGYPGSR